MDLAIPAGSSSSVKNRPPRLEPMGFVQFLLTVQLFAFLFSGLVVGCGSFIKQKLGKGGSLLIRCSLMSSKQCHETRTAFHLILCLTTTVILRRVGNLSQKIVADTGVRRAISDLFRGACTDVVLWRRMPTTKQNEESWTIIRILKVAKSIATGES
jgi:hypothetical protein